MRGRTLCGLLLLSALVAAQDGAAEGGRAGGGAPGTAPESAPESGSGHDEFGFPITFNGEILTRSDVLRTTGGLASEEVLGRPEELRGLRDRVLGDLLDARVAELNGIVIDDRMLDDLIQRSIERRGGEASFFEDLGQLGQTYAEWREQQRRLLVGAHLQSMLERGFTPSRKLVPYDLWPTPSEIATALAHERERLAGVVRMRVSTVELGPDRAERRRLVVQAAAPERGSDWLEERIRERADEALARFSERLAGGASFAELAGAGASDEGAEWQQLPPPREDEGPRLAFLRDARAGAVSEPLWQPATGSYLVVKVLAREDASGLTVDDPGIYTDWRDRIHALRAAQAAARMRLEALDRSVVRPARVREELRRGLVQRLEQAQRQLRALGLH